MASILASSSGALFERSHSSHFRAVRNVTRTFLLGRVVVLACEGDVPFCLVDATNRLLRGPGRAVRSHGTWGDPCVERQANRRSPFSKRSTARPSRSRRR